MTEKQLKELMRKRFSTKRYQHLLGAAEMARQLAVTWDVDETLAVEAALLHDYAKIYKGSEMLEMSEKRHLVTDEVYRQFPELLHAKLGAVLVKEELGIVDPQILGAITSHCYGGENMSMLDKIIFIADYIEPGRKFEGVEAVRAMAFKNINRALLMAIEGTLRHIIKRDKPIHVTSVMIRNALLRELTED
jgi:predicted HD superfamily hydrolase involved in NAD metabolism